MIHKNLMKTKSASKTRDSRSAKNFKASAKKSMETRQRKRSLYVHRHTHKSLISYQNQDRLPEQDAANGTDLQVRKLRYETLLGIALLCVSISCIIGVYSMVYAASEVGSMERQQIKQWSLVLVLLSVTTLFIGSVGGYLIGKYLYIPQSSPKFSDTAN